MEVITVVSCVAAIGVSAFCVWQAIGYSRICQNYAHGCEGLTMRLRNERGRVDVLEKQVDSLRRELRSLGGKFYAKQREEQEIDIADVAGPTPPVCENYARSQTEGPNSKAAKCECDYCTRRRKEKREFRDRQAAAGHLDPRWIAAHTSGTGNHGE